MRRIRYDFNDNVYVYTAMDLVNSNYKYTEIAFRDNLEEEVAKGLFGMGKVHCDKVVVKNGRFNVFFNRPCGSYKGVFGNNLWETIITHESLSEPIKIGIPTISILDVMQKNTVVNAELKNVYLAIYDKNLIILTQDDERLINARYDGNIRQTTLKHKTIKRESGYKYVSVSSEFNYLCDAFRIASSFNWFEVSRAPYEENAYTNFIKCGRMPITFYDMHTDSSYEVSLPELLNVELDLLDKSLVELSKAEKISGHMDLVKSFKCYAESTALVNKSILNSADTQSSLRESLNEDTKQLKKKKLSKDKAWIKNVNMLDVDRELMKLRDECHERIVDFIRKYAMPLPTEYLAYLFRTKSDASSSLNGHEVEILKAVEKYCMLSTEVVNESKTNDTLKVEELNIAYRFYSYGISEIHNYYLLY